MKLNLQKGESYQMVYVTSHGYFKTVNQIRLKRRYSTQRKRRNSVTKPNRHTNSQMIENPNVFKSFWKQVSRRAKQDNQNQPSPPIPSEERSLSKPHYLGTVKFQT